MNKPILKIVVTLMFAVSIVTLGVPSQIARSSQPIKEATEQMFNGLEPEAESESKEIPEVVDQPDASNHDIEETENTEPTTVSDSNPEIFDPLQADMKDRGFPPRGARPYEDRPRNESKPKGAVGPVNILQEPRRALQG